MNERMRTLQNLWKWFSRLSIVVKLWHLLQVALPFGAAAYTAFSGYSDELSHAELVAFTMLAFAGGLLSINQFRILIGVPIAVVSRESFKYGLTYVGINIAYEPGSTQGAMQVIVQLANSARAPIRYKVERMDVIVGTTTLPHKKFTNTGGVIPLMGRRVYRDSPFPLEVISSLIGSRHSGTVEMSIVYGPAEGEPTRRLSFKLEIFVSLQPDGAGISDLLVSEEDRAYTE